MEKHFDPAPRAQALESANGRPNASSPRRLVARGAFRHHASAPNVTGVLHIGHILGDTVQDQLIRWKHMNGFNTLWIPGTDHAGIATRKWSRTRSSKKGKKRSDMTREEFLAEAWNGKSTTTRASSSR
jgi:valyl-tRNA synthetase